MTLDEVKKRVEEIGVISSDDEGAHMMEDELYLDFVLYISKHGPLSFSDMANEILKTRRIKFLRWFA